MDLKKYINENVNGTFCILFRNVHKLDPQEIRDIFSKYGEIHRINTCGEEARLFYFIKYVKFDDAEKAVNGLQNHPKIRLLEHRTKNENKQEKNNKLFNGMQKRSQTDPENLMPLSTNKSNYRQNYQNQHSMYKQEKENYLQCDFNKENKNYNELRNNHNSVDTIPKNETEKRLEIQSNNDAKESIPPLGKSNCYKNESANQTEQKKNNINISNACEKRIKNAEEVIVGNIHSNYGVSYILHMFDEFEPIAISKMNVTATVGVRYCHVYFKSIEDSQIVEEKFDGMDLNGQKLVVLRLSHLMKEGEID